MTVKTIVKAAAAAAAFAGLRCGVFGHNTVDLDMWQTHKARVGVSGVIPSSLTGKKYLTHDILRYESKRDGKQKLVYSTKIRSVRPIRAVLHYTDANGKKYYVGTVYPAQL